MIMSEEEMNWSSHWQKVNTSDPNCLSALKQMKMRFNSKETCKAKEYAIV